MAREETNFQIKDLYQKLHDDETFLVERNLFKKDPNIETAILRNTSYDPYYHKNEFNPSHTYHYIDYILHPSTPPFERPEINEEYVVSHPKGTTSFYPSFLKGHYVDIQEKPHVFEELLLQKKEKSPSDEELILSLVKACSDEEEAIVNLQQDIKYRTELFGEQKSSFQNYYRNLCGWMITGEFPEDMNNTALVDEKGKIIMVRRYDYESIPNLQQIHTAITNLHTETVDIPNMLDKIKEVNNDIATMKAVEIKERVEKQLEQHLLTEEAKLGRTRLLEAKRAKRAAMAKKILESSEELVTIRNTIKKLANTFTDEFLELQIKGKKIEFKKGTFSWNDIKDKENEIKKDFLKSLEENFEGIKIYREQLFTFQLFLYKITDEINLQIKYVFEKEGELKLRGLLSETEGENINNLRIFDRKLEILKEELDKKQQFVTNYNLVIEWYKYTKKTLFIGLSSIVIGFYDFGRILLEAAYGIGNYEIKLTYSIFDDKMPHYEVKVEAIPDNSILDYYVFTVYDSDRNKKHFVLTLEPIKRLGDTHVNINLDATEIELV